MTELDLFGQEVVHRKGTIPMGYYWIAGTGPAGETCATCLHALRTRHYAKCKRARNKWTNGVRTDIRLRTPACKGWERTQASLNLPTTEDVV